MTDITRKKIFLAVQDIRTLAARTRPDCEGSLECTECPARIETGDRFDFECLFSLCETMQERGWRKKGNVSSQDRSPARPSHRRGTFKRRPAPMRDPIMRGRHPMGFRTSGDALLPGSER